MRNAAMAILFGFCAACSNQAATAPTPSAVLSHPPPFQPRQGYHTAWTFVCIDYDGQWVYADLGNVGNHGP